MTSRPFLVAHRLGAALLLACACLLAGAGELFAHGVLKRSAPAANARLAAVPAEIRLEFNEPVERAVAAIELVASDGRTVALGPLVSPRDSASVLVARIDGPLAAGRWTVRWRIAGRDGHPVRGEYTFTILPAAAGLASTGAGTDSAAAPGAAAAQPSPDSAPHHDPTTFPTAPRGFDAESPLYAAVRWLTYLALMGVVGAVALRYAVLSRLTRTDDASLRDSAELRVARAGLWSAGLLLLSAVFRLVAQDAALSGAADAGTAGTAAGLGMMRIVTGTTWGHGWIVQVAGALVALVGFVRAAAGARSGWAMAAVGALLASVSPALSGHAAAVQGWAGPAVLADTLHVIGAAGWLGSLAILLLAGIPAAMALHEAHRGRAVAVLVRAFSPAALAFAGLVALTGVFAAWLHLGSVPALWTSDYGRVLMLKLAVLSAVALTGVYNWRRVQPILGDDRGTARLRRSARAEVAIAVVVLAVTAVLVATPPPPPPDHAPDAGRAAEAVMRPPR